MIPLPFSDRRWDNLQKHGIAGKLNGREFEACILCCKPVFKDTNPKMIRMDVDGNAITDAEGEREAARGRDQGCFTIGPECLRRHPELKPYARTM